VNKNRLVLVMGATGRVGRSVVSHLRGHLPLRGASQTTQPDQPDLQWARFSLEDPNTHADALAGVGAIFLMRPPSIVNGRSFVPFLRTAASLNIRRLVVLSVIGADTNALLPHHRIEALVKEMGFDWTMIRPSDFMQNLETVHLSGIVARNEIAVPAGRGRSSFIDVIDVGAVIARVLTSEGHSGKGYTITGPEALSFDDVARTLTEVLGRPIRYREVGVLKFLAEHLRARLPLPLGLVMAALYSVQRFDQASLVTGEVGRLLGRPPRTLREFVVRNSAVWETNGPLSLARGA